MKLTGHMNPFLVLNIDASARSVRKYINLLGWRRIKSRYCHMVSLKNRIERFFFSLCCVEFEFNFDYNIFIDEATNCADKNGHTRWYRKIEGETRRGLVGRNAHEVSCHVIGGISRRGATELIIFSGRLDANDFTFLLNSFLRPFVENNYPDYHILHMDNAPSHTAIRTRAYLEVTNLNHFKTPAQSPDLNPIELVWNDMKH